MTPLFIDTTCNREGGTSTWETEEKPRPLETKVTTDGHVSLKPPFFR